MRGRPKRDCFKCVALSCSPQLLFNHTCRYHMETLLDYMNVQERWHFAYVRTATIYSSHIN